MKEYEVLKSQLCDKIRYSRESEIETVVLKSDFLGMQSELKAQYDESISKYRQQFLAHSTGSAYYKAERDIHIKESEVFVKEATEKITELQSQLKLADAKFAKAVEQRNWLATTVSPFSSAFNGDISALDSQLASITLSSIGEKK